jgi:hypothetical protein
MSLRRLRTPAIIYVCALGAYLGASGSRLARHSNDNHFVYLADSLLHGRLDMRVNPPHDNDWARVDELTLRDGRAVRGVFLRVGGHDRFRTTRGQVLTITPADIAQRRYRYYVSFPPLPAVLMMPFVAISGMQLNDVLFTVLLAALAPALLFGLLRRLRESGLSGRSEVDDLWLTALFAVGTVFYYCAVIGQVWYTAHVVAVLCIIGYAWFALDARAPVLAGLFLGLAFLARGPTPVFMFPLFLWEAVRTSVRAPAPAGATAREVAATVDWGRAVRLLVKFALPVAVIGALAAAFNYARFDSLTEFGHTYLNVRWTARIQRWGLFNYHFLSRNLAAWLVLTPRILSKPPYFQVSWHGMSIFLTTPAFILLVWPKIRSRLHWPLWLTILPMFLIQALYQNDGWVQFGYRFSLDFTVFLMLLLALGGRKVGWTMRVLILVGIAVNLFGAVSFGRMPGYYYDGFFPAE